MHRSIINHYFTKKGHAVMAIIHKLTGKTEDARKGRDKAAFVSRGSIERIVEVEDALLDTYSL
ncbi:hypothetical protein F5B21DRAFT_495591 [Xylaria acuta]|nr:hypothetical protein F5B21DRAFT_495591 [Xylaria acuta]